MLPCELSLSSVTARALLASGLVFGALAMSGCPVDQAGNPALHPDPTRQPPATPDTPIAAPATHAGVISIQDMSIANIPQAGHGLTVQAFFTPLRAPDFEDQPGSTFGCKASAYDLSSERPPAEADQGKLRLTGLRGGELACVFHAGRGYVCPTASGQAETTVSIAAGASRYALAEATLTEADLGRYLQISGAENPANNGAFAIVALLAPDSVAVANTRAAVETFDATYTLLAGAGPTPGDVYSPFGQMQVRVALERAGAGDFDSFVVDVTPGHAMTLDAATRAQIVAIEPTGEAISLGCDGEGGHCGAAAASVIRITTTDGDTTGLPPTAMPPAKHRVVEIQCALPDTGSVRVPAEAMELLRKAHLAAPITRIRAAFMREGFALATNAAPRPANRASILVGHGVIGFSDPPSP